MAAVPAIIGDSVVVAVSDISEDDFDEREEDSGDALCGSTDRGDDGADVDTVAVGLFVLVE
jgi:hypothetical protein